MKGVQAPAAGQPLLLGVRHHGPGSARAVRAALEAARPRVVLVEGPPEADPLIPLARRRTCARRSPCSRTRWTSPAGRRSGRWPRSPGVGRAALGAGARGARPFHRPAGHPHAGLAAGDEEDEEEEEGEGEEEREDLGEEKGAGAGAEQDALDAHVRIDPLGVLADTAGYDDAERWWEDVVEHRGAGKGTRSRRSLPWRRP